MINVKIETADACKVRQLQDRVTLQYLTIQDLRAKINILEDQLLKYMDLD